MQTAISIDVFDVSSTIGTYPSRKLPRLIGEIPHKRYAQDRIDCHQLQQKVFMAKSFIGKNFPFSVTDSQNKISDSAVIVKPQNVSENGLPVVRHSISTRFISVDSVLQHASEIPSGQPRRIPIRRKVSKKRGAHLLNLGVISQHAPGRSTNVTEKLVLIPETVPVDSESDKDSTLFGQMSDEVENGPLDDLEREVLRNRGGVRGKSYAERLPKSKRAEKLARVTAYCLAQGYKTRAAAAFVKSAHNARTKLYDDCLYTVYHLPLLPGTEGIRIKSSPILKSPGGKAVLDDEIERSEQRDYHDSYIDASNGYIVKDGENNIRSENEEEELCNEEDQYSRSDFKIFASKEIQDNSSRLAPETTKFAEIFLFSYGVVVFWNFTEKQEKDILADLTFTNHEKSDLIVTRPLEQDDYEKEEFHFEYNPYIDRPRVFNDMITLRNGDHMIKLSISHAIAQSTKLCSFEEKMNHTMTSVQHIPKNMALTGQLGLSRSQVVKILGQLFKSRVDVNLSSNILDVPNFFWDSEPTLHPLYSAIRDYLEITPRIKVLNERCKVFLELAEILSESIADTKMSMITWIIIALIIISICVTVMEVGLRSVIFGKTRSGKVSESTTSS